MIHYGNVENGRSTDGKQIFTSRWKSCQLSHRPQTPFPTAPPLDRLHTFPQRLLLLLKMSAITEMMMALILYNFRLNNKANYEADDVRSGTPYS